MLKYWTGPATVVAYVTDEEIVTLTKKLHRSEIIQNRSNIIYHVVYKRHVSTNIDLTQKTIYPRSEKSCFKHWTTGKVEGFKKAKLPKTL